MDASPSKHIPHIATCRLYSSVSACSCQNHRSVHVMLCHRCAFCMSVPNITRMLCHRCAFCMSVPNITRACPTSLGHESQQAFAPQMPSHNQGRGPVCSPAVPHERRFRVRERERAAITITAGAVASETRSLTPSRHPFTIGRCRRCSTSVACPWPNLSLSTSTSRPRRSQKGRAPTSTLAAWWSAAAHRGRACRCAARCATSC